MSYSLSASGHTPAGTAGALRRDKPAPRQKNGAGRKRANGKPRPAVPEQLALDELEAVPP